MSKLYVGYHDLFGWVCEVNLDTSEVREFIDDTLYRANYRIPGSYVNTARSTEAIPAYEMSGPGRLVGVVQSPSGPLLFIDSQLYTLEQGGCSAHLVEGDKENQFTLTVKGVEVFSIRYAKRFLDFDPWTDEVDVDFFLWLQRKISTGRLFQKVDDSRRRR